MTKKKKDEFLKKRSDFLNACQKYSLFKDDEYYQFRIPIIQLGILDYYGAKYSIEYDSKGKPIHRVGLVSKVDKTEIWATLDMIKVLRAENEKELRWSR